MASKSKSGELKDLLKLKEKGAITQEEFDKEKSKILNSDESDQKNAIQMPNKGNLGCGGVILTALAFMFILYLLVEYTPLAFGFIASFIAYNLFKKNTTAQMIAIAIIMIIAIVWTNVYQQSKPKNISTNTGNTANTTTPPLPKPDPETELFNNPEKINTNVDVEGINWRLTSAKNLGSSLKPKYSFDDNCKTSGKFIKITFTVKNNRTEMESLSDLYLYDSKKNQYNTSTDANDCVENTIYILDNINPGIKKSYTAVYEVPKDAKGFRLEVTDLKLLGNAHKYISLGF